MFEEELRNFGLSDNEIKIYLVLLKSGTTTPLQIAEKTGLHRPYIYDALARLMEKGFVSSITIKKKKNFQATQPKRLLELFKSKLEDFNKIVPQLEKIEKTAKGEIKVELFKGKRAFRLELDDILANVEEGGKVLGIGLDDKKFIGIEPIYMRKYFNKIGEKRITERIIMAKGTGKVPEAKTTKYRFLDEEFIGNTATLIYANKIFLMFLGEPNIAIIIENKEVSDTYRKQFELLWKIAEK